jgi:hypothetical protein
MCEFLKSNKHLETLSLQGNAMGDDGAVVRLRPRLALHLC